MNHEAEWRLKHKSFDKRFCRIFFGICIECPYSFTAMEFCQRSNTHWFLYDLSLRALWPFWTPDKGSYSFKQIENQNVTLVTDILLFSDAMQTANAVQILLFNVYGCWVMLTDAQQCQHWQQFSKKPNSAKEPRPKKYTPPNRINGVWLMAVLIFFLLLSWRNCLYNVHGG